MTKQCKMCEKKSRKRGDIQTFHNDKVNPPMDYDLCSECRRWLTKMFRNYKEKPMFAEEKQQIKKTRKKQGKKKTL